ncbi:hypothetical protein CIL05_07335 [Virgibacillus profundi]|uniref:PcfJ-like protein n=1 Tax=Virgibacillus profundi TaxID=2024555 RepID=A0A2A2IGQ9_9BACI|nr:PcfJ domain-containing protein [Virgibacillus profundi]PAV30273.1 hypothetical protein CIL05_07335 [Virgibacillus profundi]PXY54445.1 hypothetical protein CIT14_07420 [Virgibacillus profundi]
MKKLTMSQKIEQEKTRIRNAGYESIPINSKNDSVEDIELGTMYIKEKMDYGFHIYFIYNPDSGHPLAGKNGILTELYYDLRHKEYWIKRNLKDVKFSERNIDTIFPNSYKDREEIFTKLSTKHNQGLYTNAYRYLGAMGEEYSNRISRFFYRLITRHSYFEILYKAGLNLNSNRYYYSDVINPDETSPRGILGVSKTRWKMISRYGIYPRDLRNLGINDKADQRMINLLSYVAKLGEKYGVDKSQTFFDNESDYTYGRNMYRYESCIKTSEDYNLSEKRVIEYVYFECETTQGLSERHSVDTYHDYVRMNVEMDNINFERYPRYLRTMHDIAAMNYKINLDEIQKKNWEKKVKEHKKYEYNYKGYKLFPPQEPEDLVKEGNALSHCIGSYIRNVTNGSSTILFLRNKEEVDKSLVTVELRDGMITQARGKMNQDVTEEQSRVLSYFAKKFELKYKPIYEEAI